MFALQYGRLRPHHLCQSIVRVVVIDGTWGNELVLHKDGGRNRPLVEDVEADPDQVFSIAFWKESDRSDKASLGLAKFRSALGGSVLPHDGAGFGVLISLQ